MVIKQIKSEVQHYREPRSKVNLETSIEKIFIEAQVKFSDLRTLSNFWSELVIVDFSFNSFYLCATLTKVRKPLSQQEARKLQKSLRLVFLDDCLSERT